MALYSRESYEEALPARPTVGQAPAAVAGTLWALGARCADDDDDDEHDGSSEEVAAARRSGPEGGLLGAGIQVLIRRRLQPPPPQQLAAMPPQACSCRCPQRLPPTPHRASE